MTTSSAVWGLATVTNRQHMLFLKTHWGLHMEFNDNGVYGTKVYEPRRFNNNHGTIFMYNFELEITVLAA